MKKTFSKSEKFYENSFEWRHIFQRAARAYSQGRTYSVYVRILYLGTESNIIHNVIRAICSSAYYRSTVAVNSTRKGR